LNAAKRYGDVSNAFVSKDVISLSIDPSSAPAKTSAAFIEWEENAKIMVRRKAKFVEDSRSFVGFIMDLVGPVIDRALRVNAEFDHKYATDDVAGLWKLLKKICSEDADQRGHYLKYKFWSIRQGSLKYHDYIRFRTSVR
jgi:hypothetical protein